MLSIRIGRACLGLAFLIGAAPLAQVPEPPQAKISSPLPGEALQGSFPIVGTMLAEDFEEAVLSFSYAGDPTGTWFEIARPSTLGREVELALWDTTTLTDGNYSLQLIVRRSAGETMIVEVDGLRVRNYTAVETSTPSPTQTSPPGAALATFTPSPSPVAPTPTALPENPAQITPALFSGSLLQGVLGALGAFGLFGLFLALRALRRG
jgi:hypothetical protein